MNGNDDHGQRGRKRSGYDMAQFVKSLKKKSKGGIVTGDAIKEAMDEIEREIPEDIVTTFPDSLICSVDTHETETADNNKLKIHQKEAVRFLYKRIIESTENVQKKGGGDGAIIAHSMGLGKTGITCTFLFGILSQPLIASYMKRILIIAPKNVHTEWKTQLDYWKLHFEDAKDVQFKVLQKSSRSDESFNTIEKWYENKDNLKILVVNYESYYNILTNVKNDKEKQQKLTKYLKGEDNVDGPDIVIFDEGHRLKNNKLGPYKLMNSISTNRRIILTGTPLQNNMKELYSLIDFVKKEDAVGINHLFISEEYVPNEGLQNLLDQVMHRCGPEKLKELLQKDKTEITISLSKTPEQTKLLNTLVKEYHDANPKVFLNYYYKMRKIIAHPAILKADAEIKEIYPESKPPPKKFEELLNNYNDVDKDYLKSSKMKVLLGIIKELSALEKLVIFAENLDTITFIENRLISEFGWKSEVNYYRVDGSTESVKRGRYYDQFNAVDNKVKLFILSTKSAGVGIKLIGARRMVLFDHNYNPALNRQAVNRIYRFGQKQNVFIYRFEVKNCDDRHIYIHANKEKLFKQVIDKRNMSRDVIGSTAFNPAKLEEETDLIIQKMMKDVKLLQPAELEKKGLKDDFIKKVIQSLDCVADVSNYDDYFKEEDDVQEELISVNDGNEMIVAMDDESEDEFVGIKEEIDNDEEDIKNIDINIPVNKTEYAVDDINVICNSKPFIENISVPYTNRFNKLYEALQKKYTNIKALAIMACCLCKNKASDAWKEFQKLIDKISNKEEIKHHTLKLDKPVVKKILEIQYAVAVLYEFGYTRNDVGDQLYLPKEEVQNSITKALEFKQLRNEITEFSWTCDNSFSLVDSYQPLEEFRLPEIFFEKLEIEMEGFRITHSIEFLKKHRHQYSFAKYSIVRVEIQDGYIFQAVFLKTQSLADVKKSLNLNLSKMNSGYPVVHNFIDNDGNVIELTKKLKTFPFYPAIMLSSAE